MIFWKRFIGDYRSKTGGLTLLEKGAYDVMLDEYYATEGPLTSDTARLFRICGALSDEEQRAVIRVRDQFFRLGKDQLLHNERADAQIAADRRHSRIQREKAEGRWERQRQAELALEEAARKTGGKPEETGSGKTSGANGLSAGADARSMPPQPQPQSGRSKDLSGRAGPERAVSTARFQRFWQAYPRKEGKGRALTWWQKYKPEEDLLEAMLAAIAWQRTSGRLKPDSREGRSLVPMPASWLNDRGWEDERQHRGNGAQPAPADTAALARNQAWFEAQGAWAEINTAVRLNGRPQLNERHARILQELGGFDALKGLSSTEMAGKAGAFMRAATGAQPVGEQR